MTPLAITQGDRQTYTELSRALVCICDTVGYYPERQTDIHEVLDRGGGLVFTIHKKFSPLFISLKFWVIH